MKLEGFKNFFKVGTEESMARLLSFICALAGFVVAIGAIPLAFKGELDWVYIGLVATLWSAAFGTKNWAKSVEVKGIKENK